MGAGVGVAACLPSHLGLPEPWQQAEDRLWEGPSTRTGPRPGRACSGPSFLARFAPAPRSYVHVRLIQTHQVPGFQHPLHRVPLWARLSGGCPPSCPY